MSMGRESGEGVQAREPSQEIPDGQDAEDRNMNDGSDGPAVESNADELYDAASRLLVDPGHMLQCMRVWLAQASEEGGGEENGDDGNSSPHQCEEEGPTRSNGAVTVEEASCTLWDLTANEECAAFMVDHKLLDILSAVMERGSSPPAAPDEAPDHHQAAPQLPPSSRQLETACGMAANLACHSSLRPAMSSAASERLFGAAVAILTTSSDVSVLTEACRALTAAARASVPGAWRSALAEDGPGAAASRLVWVVDNALDPGLIERGLELAGTAACLSEAAMGAILLRSGMVRSSAAHLAAFCGTLGGPAAMNGRGGTGEEEEAEEHWGEERGMMKEEAKPHPLQPSSSEAVADAALRVLEVAASHVDGAAELQKEEPVLSRSLVKLLSGNSENEELEEGAALVLAGWHPDASLRTLLRSPAALQRLSAMLEQESVDGQDAAWDLMGAICSRLGQSISSGRILSDASSQQPAAPLMMAATAGCGGGTEAISDCNAAAAVAEGLRKFAAEEPVPPGREGELRCMAQLLAALLDGGGTAAAAPMTNFADEGDRSLLCSDMKAIAMRETW